MKKKTSLADIPSSVYRLQINEKFPLKKAMAVLPYLKDLGIEGIYCFPLFACASSHGYDVTDPNCLNPLIGTSDEFNDFFSLLQDLGIKLLFDVVPNHMSIKGGKNPWWQDVMAKGKESPYAGFFDIYWNSEKSGLQGKILLPILKDPYGRALENGQIRVVWKDGFWIQYADFLLPVALGSYDQIFHSQSNRLSSIEVNEEKDWLECITIVSELEKTEEERSEKIKNRLVDLYRASPFVRLRIEEIIAQVNGKKGDPQSFNELDKLLEKQFYRLGHWVLAEKEINYHRFFNINDLIAIHIEKENVFRAHHRLCFDLLSSKKVQGLRIDHVDGLYDPQQYFARLQEKHPAFVMVEKILSYKEKLPENWDVDGTVGYEFLNLLCGLFVRKKNEKAFTAIYKKFINAVLNFEEELYERKKRYVFLYMTNETFFLGEQLSELANKNRYYRDFTRIDLTYALREIIACFPIYRTYIKEGGEITKTDRASIEHAVNKAKTKTPDIDPSVYQYLHDLLLLELPGSAEEDRTSAIDFLMRFQQLTGPVMAKGLEDSTFFIYNRLISLNEVGGCPQCFGRTRAEFHAYNKEKLSKWQLGLLPTSTHDTKTSEDVRLRLHVLSEMPQEWRASVLQWKKHNRKYKKSINGSSYPDANTEYYLYQMLLGIWEEVLFDRFTERLWPLFQKILREAGTHTSWRMPNENYEAIAKDFLLALITPGPENYFLSSFVDFQQKIARYGYWNSLSALVLKMGSCGIVDIYQGQEWWDLCLVDPDNRREVDFEMRKAALERLDWTDRLFSEISQGDVKMWVTHKALQLRTRDKELFLQGSYIPLKIQNEHVIAFMRTYGQQIAVVLAARFFSTLTSNPSSSPLGEDCWGTLELALPIKNTVLHHIFTGKIIHMQKKDAQTLLPVSQVFADLPFAILTPEKI